MDIRTMHAKSILTPQKRGFLTKGPYPFTHTLSWAVGCGFGNIYCGKYCYAQLFPNWAYSRQDDESWGEAIILKENAPELLDDALKKARNRSAMRIFMSSVTDPYQPIERRYRLTRQCLEVFARYDDLDLLVIQTRSPLVTDDLPLLASIPYIWLSMTLETDRPDLPYGPTQTHINGRLEAVRAAVEAGISTQIAVSPCMPYTENFVNLLISSGAHQVIVDTFEDGDGSGGERTAETPFAYEAQEADFDWYDVNPPSDLYDALHARGVKVGWSASGFTGIAPRIKEL